MGYNFHMTRAADFWESEETPIDKEEWEQLADNTSDLVLEGHVGWSDIGPQRVYAVSGESFLGGGVRWRSRATTLTALNESPTSSPYRWAAEFKATTRTEPLCPGCRSASCHADVSASSLPLKCESRSESDHGNAGCSI
ncbi:hypothetical protein Q0Z83_044160 [Actinoplanes sichuanensis]|nr:hypothetical protein Q0Z83_044160 [Actinoplanes sichuanensis]